MITEKIIDAIEILECIKRGFIPFELHDAKLWITGTFQIKEDRICISHALCEGKLKYFMEYLINKFKTNNILIYNVLTDNWHLKGFNPIIIRDEIYDEDVLCLEGKWLKNP